MTIATSVKDYYVFDSPFYAVSQQKFFQKHRSVFNYVKTLVSEISLANYLGMRFTLNSNIDVKSIVEGFENDSNFSVYDFIADLIKKINSYYPTDHCEYDYKIITSNNIIYSIVAISDNGVTRILFQTFDSKNQVVESSLFEANSVKGKGAITRVGSFVYAQREQIARRFIEIEIREPKALEEFYKDGKQYEADYGIGCYDKNKFIRLAATLKTISDNITNFKFSFQRHNSIELSFIRKLIWQRENVLPFVRVPLYFEENFSKEIMHSMLSYSYNNKYNEMASEFFKEFNENYKDTYSLDLSDEQVKVVSNYVRKNYYKLEKVFNLGQIISNQRFGNTFKINIDAENLPEGEVLISSFYDKENDMATIQLFYNIDKKYDFLFNIDIRSASTFKDLETNLRSVDLVIKFKDQSNLLENIKDYDKILPDYFKDVKPILALASTMVAVYTMIFDKPVKFCAAKETRKSSTSIVKKQKEENQVIVKHIIALRTIINQKMKSTETSGVKKEVEYVIENWDRQGHFRKYANGKQVWISATTCHRHLDLTDKKVKITL